MKKTFLIIMIMFISCKKSATEFEFKTKDRNILNNVSLLNQKCEELFLKSFSEKEFEKYFKLNSKETYLRCGENKFRLNDSVNCKPNFYRISYDFSFENNFQETIEIDFDSLNRQININTDLLKGLRRFADNKIKINRQTALEIARKYEISGENINIFFKIYKYPKSSPKYKSKNSILYYWEITKECNHCNSISVDAESGNVFEERISEYVY
ncbi:hypothetical protein GON26_07480 [Flavobacterium sp. GA093]|uniref:Lipoprotein n=1 Tax=Flavobacterium hydrocarbonoxydans TaxID=2683249 RepID=A0A6I4NR73_9FLAO|nr:hypothetical protein [Flavobacterium hydrocarbonoxydans]MWB94199.1 hypothetical protein [Flavobacterium hydrocarbonoxydans]